MTRNKKLQALLIFMGSALVACGLPETSELDFQTYRFKRMQPQEVELPPGLTLVLGAATYELFSDEGEIASGNLKIEEKEDWLEGCASANAYVSLQTAVLKGEFTLGPHLFSDPWVAPDCFDSNDVYLSVGKEEKTGPCVGLSCLVFEMEN
jgi:hypothetical protein